jgi:HEAT repeat protein
MKRLIGILIVAALVAGGTLYYVRTQRDVEVPDDTQTASADWLDALYSQNPRDVEAATEQVAALGARAVPAIQATLQDPNSEADRLKAALKACTIIGPAAAPAIPEVAAVLAEPGLTAEAAMALSYMGREALPPLREGLSSRDPIVRREALRSIGKLKERAPLELSSVLPLLINGLKDRDESVRAVAATYLGIIHEGAERAVPALVGSLSDPDPEVRRAAAAALGSFEGAAAPALPALRKARRDSNEDVAREAGLAIVKIQEQQ